jgi:hypothetical protein
MKCNSVMGISLQLKHTYNSFPLKNDQNINTQSHKRGAGGIKSTEIANSVSAQESQYHKVSPYMHHGMI